MSAEHLIQYLSWALFLLVCISVTVHAVRAPRRVTIDIALFFLVPAIIISTAIAAALGVVLPGRVTNALNSILLLSMGYLLLRLVFDFSDVPFWMMRGAELALALFAICVIVFVPPLPPVLIVVMLAYLTGLLLYSALAFARESRRSSGVTRRRMQAAAVGSSLLVLVFVFTGLRAALPAADSVLLLLNDLSGLAAGVSYYLSFASPRWLRRAWQEPELRAFLGRAASLPRLLDINAIIGELERGAATSLGAPSARIGLYDAEAHRVYFPLGDPSYAMDPNEPIPAAQAFRYQRPAFSADVAREHPEYAALSRKWRLKAVLAAPISAGEKRLGVLVVHAPRAPIFAEDDLALVQLLADQAAVILENRTLIDEATRVRAREEATRLREDFLSAAAHDLKTPLTTLIAKAQLMERQAIRDPNGPADLAGLQLLVREGQRLKQIVLELLDAARAEQGNLVGERVAVDLVALAEEICARHSAAGHRCTVENRGPVIGMCDVFRITQLLENLTENAIKYSPFGSDILLKIWSDDDCIYLSVSDQGIGIPAHDLPHIFERFYRAANVDDRRFAGMGLGLFICRGIVEQHGGRIHASSRPGQGSTFHVELPLAPVMENMHV
ncbi:MAG TPA: ATP-binding protein [Roseiflexaceae bacterium]|nr:ATP-binding protein [Roseiflexaceae bacterium]